MDFHRIKNFIQSEHTLLNNEWKGAVVFLCDNEYVYFIKRSEKMPSHSGQLAFIGGHKHELEIDPWIVAQREFEEESGLGRDELEFCGYLPVVMASNFSPIIPVLTKLKLSQEEFFKRVKSNGEWDEILAYPWKELMIEKNWEYAWRYGHIKAPIYFHSIRPKSFISLNGLFENHLLWGATASMVWDLLRLYYKDS